MSYMPKHCVVWAEIPVTDLDKSVAFYKAVTGFDLKIDDTGPNKIAMFMAEDEATGVAGHLYVGLPSAKGEGPTVHLGVEGKLEDAAERLKAAGGTVISPPIGIPAGRFVYGQDLDGNSISLFEYAS